MPLPERIRIKTNSDAGESSLTRVMIEQIDLATLIEQMLGYTGKDAALLQEVLARGSFVSGSNRMRWDGFSVTPGEAASLLDGFPSAEPDRIFKAAACTGACLLEGRMPIEIPKAAAASRRLLHSKSYWDVLMDVADTQPLTYLDYSYKLRADHYKRDLFVAETTYLKKQTSLLNHTGLAEQVLENDFRVLELFTHR